ncbi:Striatin family-domain-containing protein [Chytriomyces sp. MP71]|nr:Striatin family-domain-containing protein [Chytriomyces sp. MP71]
MEGGSQHPNGSNGGTGLTLPSVLHFLNTEWRRFERERSEWVLEREALKASLAQLSGAKLALETKNADLLRRVKMLQFALQSERLRMNTTDESAPDAVPASVIDNPVDPPPPPPPLPFSKGPLHTRSKEVLKAFLREADFLLSLSAAKPSSFLDSHLTSSTTRSRTSKVPISSVAPRVCALGEGDAFPDSFPVSTTGITTFDRDSGEQISPFSSSSSSYVSSDQPISKVSILKNPTSNSNPLLTSHLNGPGRKERTSSINYPQEGVGGMTGGMTGNATNFTTSTKRVTVKSVDFVEVTDLDTVDSLPLHHGSDMDVDDIDTNAGATNTPEHSLVLNGDENVILVPDTTDLSEDAHRWKPKASLNR